MVHPHWLFPVTFLSFTCLHMSSRKASSITSLRTEVRLIGQQFPRFSSSPSIKMAFVLFPDCHLISKMIERDFAILPANAWHPWMQAMWFHSLVFALFSSVVPNSVQLSCQPSTTLPAYHWVQSHSLDPVMQTTSAHFFYSSDTGLQLHVDFKFLLFFFHASMYLHKHFIESGFRKNK